MNLGFKLNNHQKSNLAQIIALILTTIILFTITLGIYKILNPQKIVKVIPHLHLKTNDSMIYEFSIKRFNKADTIFITQNKNRFFLIGCSSYSETICNKQQVEEQNYIIQELDIVRLGDKFFIKNISWINSLTQEKTQHTLNNQQLIDFHKVKSEISKLSIAVFLLFTCGAFFLIIFGGIYKILLSKLSIRPTH
ncbi:hypothetical protein MMO38_06415 [Acinetobacter sp. NIPH 1852]|uniref:hypothetical protein n=1 Tax=Acinetobacter sp. NIPH 1852 TaxID=2923428 RepID=UPI001F4A7482|nr:hypothetical protein [Acinetobacter sp. NIPH 1852]MCH7307772.1 hypothetical protein [Acinetobacter sp. NIPH 1852]